MKIRLYTIYYGHDEGVFVILKGIHINIAKTDQMLRQVGQRHKNITRNLVTFLCFFYYYYLYFCVILSTKTKTIKINKIKNSMIFKD